MYGSFFNPYHSFYGSPMGGYGAPMSGYGSPYAPQYAPAYPGMFAGIGGLGGMQGFGGVPMFGFGQAQPFGQQPAARPEVVFPSDSSAGQQIENQQFRPSVQPGTQQASPQPPQNQPFQPTRMDPARFDQLMQIRRQAMEQQRTAPAQQFTPNQMNEMMSLRNKIGQENRAPTPDESARLSQLGDAYMNSGPMRQIRGMQEQMMRSRQIMSPIFSMFR